MENTPTVCASDLFTNLRIFKNDRKSRSVNSCFQRQDLDPNIEKMFSASQNSAQERVSELNLSETSAGGNGLDRGGGVGPPEKSFRFVCRACVRAVEC